MEGEKTKARVKGDGVELAGSVASMDKKQTTDTLILKFSIGEKTNSLSHTSGF